MPPVPAKPAGRLSVVSTPIGNLDDITLRALTTLRNSDLILAEDTRRTRKLCARHDIKVRLRSFHAHSKSSQVDAAIRRLLAGDHLSLVTDGGTPLISDPGAALAAAAVTHGIPVESIPGPSAVTAALVVSGLRFDAFRFVGFLPRGGKRRREALEMIRGERGATVLFESPARVAKTLTELARSLGDEREMAVCREMTKMHEEIARGTIAELAERFRDGARGEITMVIAGVGPSRAEPEPKEIEAAITELLGKGASARDTAGSVADVFSLPRKKAYALVLKHRESKQ
jgi:16S rRNA (cytidine1402-2'-O)-methyltransferase